MFAPDVIVAQQPGFFDPVLNHFFHARAEGNFTKGHGGAAPRQITLDFEPNLLRGQPHLLNDHECDAVRFAENGEDQVLRSQIIILVTFSLFSR